MKIYRRLVFIIILLALFSTDISSIGIRMGVSGGYGSSYNQDLGDTYGYALIYAPYFGMEFSNGFSIILGYEGGYKKKSRSYDPAVLELSGFQVLAEYSFLKQRVAGTIKVGLGYYDVKKIYNSEELANYNINDKNLGVLFGLGINIPVDRNFYATLDVMNLVLNAKQLNRWINVGGVRYSAGLMIRFNFKRAQVAL
ncbi:MAG: hypothetical protein KAR14_04855 [Candidatus Aminicenantes bacterium]|nr:hypothetical protein [Candidatus Aminicenantes bacterium]